MEKLKIQFVCLGNICRSPLAHAVFQNIVKKNDFNSQFLIESSGTGSWHIGDLPDHRMRREALKHNVIMDHRARQFSLKDLGEYDLILAMDNQNYKDIISMAKSDEALTKVKLFGDYDPIDKGADVPDPYYGGAEGFSNVYSIVERTSINLYTQLLKSK